MSEPKNNSRQSQEVQPDLLNVRHDDSSGSDKRPRKVLSLFDSICIIVGIIIGSGIFETAPRVAKNAGSTFWTISFWVIGGMLAVVGATCFAELTGRFKDQVGGDYVYLKKAYGQRFGKTFAFLFAWAAFWIIRPGNIGAMAMVFARYFNQIVPVEKIIGQNSLIPYAFLAVVVLSLTNLMGLRQGKFVQNILTVSKVLGMAAIVFIAFISPAAVAGAEEAVSTATPAFGAIWLSMIFVMFTYGGWNDIAFVAGEVKNPRKNLFRSLILGTLVVTGLYILINMAFIYGLGFEAMAGSEAVATDLVRECLGPSTLIGQRSSQLISALVCIACLGAINGMILVGPRIYYALGRDFEAFTFLARWSHRRDGPWQATLIQGMITCGLILLCLGYTDAFDVIITVTAPIFWGFLGLTVIGLIFIRMNQVGADNDSFRVPLFPLPPLLFAAVCFCLVYAGIDYLITKQYQVAALVVNGFMVAGIVLSFRLKPRDNCE